MNFFSHNKYLFWLLIFLVVVNISALVTMFVIFPKLSVPEPQRACGNTGKCISEELALSSGQTGKVNQILEKNKNQTQSFRDTILNNRANLLEEIAKPNPDTVIINKYIEAIYSAQKEIQKTSVDQYLALKEICTPEQSERLSNLYFELYGCQGKCKSAGQGKGMKHQYRWGQGHQGKGKNPENQKCCQGP